jgi:hypothetical protein
MKNLTSSITVLTIALIFTFFGTIQAQIETPDWATTRPIKKGFVYGVGIGKSGDLPMASDKARLNALRDLTNNYNGKFETYAAKCDTILGAYNKVREVVRTIKLQQKAKLTAVEFADKKVDSQDGLTIVYTLLQLDVSDDIKLLKKEVESDKKLRRKMDEKGLLKILDGL